MSQEAVPEQAASANPVPQSVPGQQAAPKGLLQQMEELMAALTADLSQLDADLQTTGDRPSTNASTTESHREERDGRHDEGRYGESRPKDSSYGDSRYGDGQYGSGQYVSDRPVEGRYDERRPGDLGRSY
ncbi:hypothetical protein GCM10010329_27350 [Streptomyces spiroverticillatus]|uniref:Uncharacterized protein n=1 Tax=Streptomyces finlayi TaxID=67296 RepID=A0A918WVM3_9ACTN|nr:hypothetical protein [Streptomyces finlayi]GHA03516.1 hypothetical protein GCM10010329_27350 [Streptomyces spiroverticillatus]GHC87685.1 hypothetical protein GCM10010334_19760 [Streptomyces finlayi]